MEEVVKCYDGRCYRLLLDEVMDEYYLVEEFEEQKQIVWDQ